MKALDQVVSETRAQLQQLHERGLSMNELNTRVTLIEPILAALGWDLRNVDEVDREYKRKPSDNPVDFALLLMKTPRLFIEAKAMGMNIHDDKWVVQVLSYAAMAGVEWCVVTNGDEYRLYNAHAAVDVDGKLFRTVCISDADHHAFTVATLDLLSKSKLGENLLSTLWKAQFVDRRVAPAVRELFRGPDARLVRLLHSALPELRPPEIRDSLKRADLRITFPTESIEVAAPASPNGDEATMPVAPQLAAERQPVERQRGKTPKMLGVTVPDLIAARLLVPPLELQRKYKGASLTATVLDDGRVEFAGVAHDSLSMAAGMARATVIGIPDGRTYPQTNGWTFWLYRDQADGRLVEIDRLRQRLLESRTGG